MATKWFQSEPPVKLFNRSQQCGPCSNGQHLGHPTTPNCVERACSCWCRFKSVPPRREPEPFPYRADTRAVLQKLYEAGVECRGTESGKLVWRPKPAEMSPWLRMAIRSHELDLVHVLYPRTEAKPIIRDFWAYGPLTACIGCGELCAHYDPLGQCRHSWCGWLRAG